MQDRAQSAKNGYQLGLGRGKTRNRNPGSTQRSGIRPFSIECYYLLCNRFIYRSLPDTQVLQQYLCAANIKMIYNMQNSHGLSDFGKLIPAQKQIHYTPLAPARGNIALDRSCAWHKTLQPAFLSHIHRDNRPANQSHRTKNPYRVLSSRDSVASQAISLYTSRRRMGLLRPLVRGAGADCNGV